MPPWYCRFWCHCHGCLTKYVELWVAYAPGMPGTFPPPPWVSNPDMHHGTCVTHVPWCMPGSQTSGRENVPGIPGACANRNFTSLLRGQLKLSRHMEFVFPQSMKMSWHGNVFRIINPLYVVYPYIGTSMSNFLITLDSSLNKQSSCRWFETLMWGHSNLSTKTRYYVCAGICRCPNNFHICGWVAEQCRALWPWLIVEETHVLDHTTYG